MTIRYYTRQPMGEPSTHVFFLFSVVLWYQEISAALLPQVKNTQSPGIGPSLRGRSSSSSRTSKPKMEALEVSDGRHCFRHQELCQLRRSKKHGENRRDLLDSSWFFKHFIWVIPNGPGHNFCASTAARLVSTAWTFQWFKGMVWDDPRLEWFRTKKWQIRCFDCVEYRGISWKFQKYLGKALELLVEYWWNIGRILVEYV